MSETYLYNEIRYHYSITFKLIINELKGWRLALPSSGSKRKLLIVYCHLTCSFTIISFAIYLHLVRLVHWIPKFFWLLIVHFFCLNYWHLENWMLQFFQKEVPSRFDSIPDVLMAAAYSVKYSAKRMKKWEKDYTTLKIKEQEDLEEVRVRFRPSIDPSVVEVLRWDCHPFYLILYKNFAKPIVNPYMIPVSSSENPENCYGFEGILHQFPIGPV